jgi:hypothetical protein
VDTKTIQLERALAELKGELARAITERNVALEEAYRVAFENERLRGRSVA